MRSKDFDKKIATRLNDIPEVSSPDAWSRIQSRVPLPLWLLLLKKHGFTALMLGNIALVSLGLWYSAELNSENKSLVKAIGKSENRIALVERKLNALEMELKGLKSRNNMLKNPFVSSTDAGISSNLDSDSPGHVSENTSRLGQPNTYERMDHPFRQIAKARKPRFSDQKYSAQVFPNQDGSAFSNTDSGELHQSEVAPTVVSDSASSLIAKQIATPKKAGDQKAGDSLSTVSQKSHSQARSFLSQIKPRIGAELLTNFSGLTGSGISLEFPFGKNVGLSMGLVAYKEVRKDFNDETTFNKETHRVFREEYGDNLKPYAGSIQEITLKTSLIEWPIRFKYYLPLSSKWSFTGSLGSHFNISLKQNIRYETHENGLENYHTIKHRPNAQMFHNFVFSSGLQYQVENYFFQVSPFYQFNFRQIDYLDQPSIFGLGLSLWIKP